MLLSCVAGLGLEITERCNRQQTNQTSTYKYFERDRRGFHNTCVGSSRKATASRRSKMPILSHTRDMYNELKKTTIYINNTDVKL
jgi:hypothetical protein